MRWKLNHFSVFGWAMLFPCPLLGRLLCRQQVTAFFWTFYVFASTCSRISRSTNAWTLQQIVGASIMTLQSRLSRRTDSRPLTREAIIILVVFAECWQIAITRGAIVTNYRECQKRASTETELEFPKQKYRCEMQWLLYDVCCCCNLIVLWLAWMCCECTWHRRTFLVQLYWHLAIKLYCILLYDTCCS